MLKKYASAGLAIVIDALVVTLLTAVLVLLYWLVTGASGEYLVIVSNILFLEGGVILTFGALIAFFNMGSTREIRRLIYSPLRSFERIGFFRAAGLEDKDQEQGAGWLLIFLGATLIIFSVLTSINHLI
jgi:hypothetical protein